MKRRSMWAMGAAAVAAGVIGLGWPGGWLSRAQDPLPGGATYDQAFWTHWSDGKAELCGYDLVYPRYGEARKGVAVSIVVKEDLLEKERVKANQPGEGSFRVLKQNLIKDFPTGLYDYGLMTSSFVTLEPGGGLPAGFPSKVSFSAQEWCGHAYQQALFDRKRVRRDLHSYFQGEGDRRDELPYKPKGTSEDTLALWARGFASPQLKAGQSETVPVLESAEIARLTHKPATWVQATLSRAKASQQIKVPAGAFEVDVLSAKLPARTWTFYVERKAPRRLVRWTCSNGEEGSLIASKRLPYWELNHEGEQRFLKEIGLEPRAARRP